MYLRGFGTLTSVILYRYTNLNFNSNGKLQWVSKDDEALELYKIKGQSEHHKEGLGLWLLNKKFNPEQ